MVKGDRALRVGVAALAVALASQVHAGDLIVNGSFSAGDTGFSSAYVDVTQIGAPTPATNFGAGTVANPWNSWNETTYAVGTNANLYHDLWYNVPAPNGTGNYLIVNGNSNYSEGADPAFSTSVAVPVWSETVTAAPDTWYKFSAQATGVYPQNAATLEFAIDGVQVGSTLTVSDVTAPDWLPYSSEWYSGAGGPITVTITDLSLVASGNDFGVDAISLSTPETSTWAMMGLGFAGLAFAGFRARRTPVAAAL